jgi:hypothetical protein
MSRASGALAIVLHPHMPYVEGFGAWHPGGLPAAGGLAWLQRAAELAALAAAPDGHAPALRNLAPYLARGALAAP